MPVDLTQLVKEWKALFDGVTITTIVVSVSKTFEWFDGFVSDKARLSLSRWLSSKASEEGGESWSFVFPRLLDRIYGQKPLSHRFFVMSSLSSMLATLICTVLWIRLRHPQHDYFPERLSEIYFGLFIDAMVNTVADYFSLLISRYILRLMIGAKGVFQIALLFLIDLLLTTALALLFIGQFNHTAVGNAVRGLPLDRIYDPNGCPWAMIPCKADFAIAHDVLTWQSPLAIFFYSAFFTSAWVLLYLVSTAIIRVTRRVRFIWVRIVPYLDIEKKPLIAIGRVSGLLAGLCYSIILGMIWVAHHAR